MNRSSTRPPSMPACNSARWAACTCTRGRSLAQTCASLQLPPPPEGPRRDITRAARKGTFESGDASVHQSVLTCQDDGDVIHTGARGRRRAQQVYAAEVVLRAYRRHWISNVVQNAALMPTVTIANGPVIRGRYWRERCSLLLVVVRHCSGPHSWVSSACSVS